MKYLIAVIIAVCITGAALGFAGGLHMKMTVGSSTGGGGSGTCIANPAAVCISNPAAQDIEGP